MFHFQQEKIFRALRYCAKNSIPGFEEFHDGMTSTMIRYGDFLFVQRYPKEDEYVIDDRERLYIYYIDDRILEKRAKCCSMACAFTLCLKDFPEISGPWVRFQGEKDSCLKFSLNIYRRVRSIFHLAKTTQKEKQRNDKQKFSQQAEETFKKMLSNN